MTRVFVATHTVTKKGCGVSVGTELMEVAALKNQKVAGMTRFIKPNFDDVVLKTSQVNAHLTPITASV